MKWYFTTSDDRVTLRARMESGDGTTVGDAIESVEKDGDFYGVSYDELRAARHGAVEVNNNHVGRIIK